MQNPKYYEVLSYLTNAEKILKEKAGKKNGEYANIEIVQTASRIAYDAVILAIDAYLEEKEELKFTKPNNIEEYRLRVAKQNEELLNSLNAAYDMLYLVGFYHGTLSKRTMANGLSAARTILNFLPKKIIEVKKYSQKNVRVSISLDSGVKQI